jgi:hypothetical protein
MEFVGSSFAPHPVSVPVSAEVPTFAVAREHLTFDDLLDIVNPLQHLPVVGTLYRAITHDTIKTPEKIIGDALFGGLTGLISSVADTAFEQITGKNFGDTILSFLIGDHRLIGTEVAKAEPAPAPAPDAPEAALAQSLAVQGIDPALQQRALFAYRRATSTFAN